MIGFLGVTEHGASEQQERDAKLKAAHAALVQIEELPASQDVSERLLASLWLEYERLMAILMARKVRSYQRLLVEVFGRLAAAVFVRNVLPQSV